jgi:pimeloyl-ACP methyl ester carboxylesterase
MRKRWVFALIRVRESYRLGVHGTMRHLSSRRKLILFLHGFPEFWYEWKNQLAEFGRDYRAIAPDMRGYNLSSKPAEVDQYKLKTLVEDVRALAESLGERRFVLVGHDWGGGVAWAFAAYHPEYLEKLVIINCRYSQKIQTIAKPGIIRRQGRLRGCPPLPSMRRLGEA